MWYSSEADEHCELLRSLGSAAFTNKLWTQVIDIPHPVVGIIKFLHMAPGTLDYVLTTTSTHINETDL